MRSSVLLTSAMAIGAMAGPLRMIEKRYIVTEIDLTIVTKTVYVTAGAPAPTPEHHYPVQQPAPSHKSKSKPSPSPSPSKQPPVYSQPPVHSQPPVVTPTPKPTPKPTPTPSPKPIPSSSQAPAPSPSAPAAGGHKSGEIQATFSSGPDYQAAVLYHHNAARANHGAGTLVWDTACETNARIAAEKCIFDHYIPKDAGQGQNIFTHSGDEFNVTAAITESWYKSEFEAMQPYWGSASIPEDVFHSVGHLTAMLWKKTTKVGCVSHNCGANMKVNGKTSNMNKFTVCNYAEAGNVGGGYAENVGAPISNNLGSWLD